VTIVACRLASVVVATAVGCTHAVPATPATPATPTTPILFALSTTSSPCGPDGCATSSTTVYDDGRVVSASRSGPTREVHVPPERLAAIRSELDREAASVLADPPHGAPLEDISVSCAIWYRGQMVDVSDPQRCLTLENHVMAPAP
jgi:hypothetical protein